MLLINISACNSIVQHLTEGHDNNYYLGVQKDVELLDSLGTCTGCFIDMDLDWIIATYAVIDFPFSAVLDTLLLPIDYYVAK